MAMEKVKVIVINSGSLAMRYALYQGEKKIASFYYEKLPDSYELHENSGDNVIRNMKISVEDFEKSFGYTIDRLLKLGKIITEDEIKLIALRIVAPGTFFTQDRIIDEEFLDKFDDFCEQSQLHIKEVREELEQVKERMPSIRFVAISDSRFHTTMPIKAKIYGIPKSLREEHDIYRFGYHGISISSVVQKIQKTLGKIEEKTIVCHLGGGSSVTALLNGESVETSMGYSPLEGLPMSTRIGNIDSGALMALAGYEDLDLPELRKMLSSDSGLKGISAETSDIRILLKNIKEGHEDSKLAVEHYIYQIQKQIGAMIAVLGGLDSLILTGTISERSVPIRKMILSGLSTFGILFDEKLNDQEVDNYKFINKPGSPVSIIVVSTDENKEILSRALKFL